MKLRGCHPLLVRTDFLCSLPVLLSQSLDHVFACLAPVGISICNSYVKEGGWGDRDMKKLHNLDLYSREENGIDGASTT